MKTLGIDEFVDGIISDCNKNFPEPAKVVVTREQQEVFQGDRYFELKIVYSCRGNQQIYTTGVCIDRGDTLPDYAESIRSMFAAKGIHSEIKEEVITSNGKKLLAKIIDIDFLR